MTSLQKQLAAIAATSTHELDLKAQRSRHSQSLLFDPKIAVSQSFDTLYQICIEGFEDLCGLDTRFATFRSSLFSPQSKDEDRAHMTKKENEELDEVIKVFLGLVGARLLLSPAVKAVEWLVRRFRIHELNTSSMILTFLPYHSTQLFPTLLSILPNQLPNAFKFLHPYKQRLTSPSLEAVVHSASISNEFFQLLNRYVLDASKLSHHHHNLVAFWAPVTVQSIDARLDATMSGRMNIQTGKQEELLNILFPILSEGLALRNAPEVQLGCYMIVTVLIKRTSLTKQVTEALMTAVALNWTDDTFEAGLSCLAVIVETSDPTNLPKSCARAIFNNRKSDNALRKLQKEQSVEDLVLRTAMVAQARLTKNDAEHALAFLEEAMEKPLLPPQFLRQLSDTIGQTVNTENQSMLADIAARVQRLAVLGLQYQELNEDRDENEPDSDSFMGDEDQSSSQDTDQLLSRIAELNLNPAAETGSFFSVESNTTFSEISNLILPSLQGAMNPMLVLSAIPGFEPEAVDKAHLLLSFLARAWCGAEYHATGKGKMLRACHELLDKLEGSASNLKDLVPYVLIALTDSSQKVRRQASKLLARLERKLDGSKSQGKTSIIYSWLGSGRKSHDTLSDEHMLHFLSTCITPHMNECVADSNHLTQLLHMALDSGSKGNEISKKLKSDEKASIFKFLAAHAVDQPQPDLMFKLVRLLNAVQHVRGKSRSTFLFPCLQSWISTGRQSSISPEPYLNSASLATMDNVFFQIVQAEDTAHLTVVEELATNQSTDNEEVNIAALRRIKHVWDQIEESRQRQIATSLLDLIVTSNGSIHRQADAMKSLRLLSRHEASVCTMVEKATAELEESGSPHTRKKRRTESGFSTSDDHHSKALSISKITILLEVVESAKQQGSVRVFNAIFRVLAGVHSYGLRSSSDLAYLENLALSIISDIMSKFQATRITPKIDDSAVRIDVVVDCIRNTSSSQTRNSAILLLSKLVHFVPQNALQNIIPIFTFVSATTARHNDEFAAHVVDQTMREVIPVLSQTLRKRDQNLAEATSEIILSFAAAFDHVPEPRRVQLFTLLGTSIGPSECLFAIVAALVDRNVEDSDVGDFIGQLLRQFPVPVVLRTFVVYLDLVLESFEAKPHLFAIYVRSGVDIDSKLTSVNNLMNALCKAMSNTGLVAKIRKAANKGFEDHAQVTADFGNVIERVIKLVKKSSSDALRRASAGVLERMLEIMPFEQLIQTSTELLARVDEGVQTGVLRSIEKQVKILKNTNSSITHATMQFLPEVTSMLTTAEDMALKCSIVSCTDQICEKFGATDPSATLNAAAALLKNINFGTEGVVLRTLSLHCLASMAEVLQTEFVPLLQQSLQVSISCILEATHQSSVEQERLHDAGCAVLISTFEHLPYMITKKSVQEILEVMQRSAQSSTGSSAQESRRQVLRLAATKLELKTAVDSAIKAWPRALNTGLKSLHAQLDFLKTSIEHHSKAEVSQQANFILNGMLEILDLRTSAAAHSFTEEQLASIEHEIISTLITIILKINDMIFRPFFTKLVDWASESASSSKTSMHHARARTLFAFLQAFSDRLKSIVTSYFDAPLDLAATILKSRPEKSVSAQAIQAKRTVLSALSSSFANDQDDFFAAPHRFTRICEPLLDQLSLHASNLQYLTSSAIPALASFATAVAASPDHLKELNTTLLRLLKSDSAKIRFAALKTEMEFTRRLGEEWLALLPEMLPVISELQEDGDESVERETIRWVKMVEETLGESLDSMLT